MRATIKQLGDACIVEMFRRVGLNMTHDEAFDWASSHGEKWYEGRTWTSGEQEDFREWMVAKLVTDGDMSTKKALAETENFLLGFGWITSDE